MKGHELGLEIFFFSSCIMVFLSQCRNWRICTRWRCLYCAEWKWWG